MAAADVVCGKEREIGLPRKLYSSASLYRRVVRSGASGESSFVPKRRQWSERSMEHALQDVSSGVLTVRRAALEHNIPKSTLHDRVSGRVLPGAQGGAPRYLDNKEEEELVRWLEGCAEVGCAKSVREVRAIVGAIVAKKHSMECVVVSHGWWDRFRARHPHLRLRAGESLAYVRAACTSRAILDRYFDLLEDVVKKNSLKDKPGRIFNLDESGIPLQHRPGRRIGVKGQKHVNVLVSGNKTNVTVLACVSASGFAMPPMVIYNRKNLTLELTRGEVVGTRYGLSSSGWIDSELFCDWFHQHFLEYAPSVRPLLLLLDGHSSHYSPDFIREACEKGIIVFCLPPHTTHVSQPLDATCFHSLKVYWDRACDEYMSCNPGKIVSIYQFSQLLAKAWNQAMTPRNVVSGFRATGVFPVNRHAIILPGEQRHTGTPTAVLAKKKGISFMPFYSPMHDAQQFTEEEEQLFRHRFDEGYDLTDDERYNLWLKIRHSSSLQVDLFTDSPSSSPQVVPMHPSPPLAPHLPLSPTLSPYQLSPTLSPYQLSPTLSPYQLSPTPLSSPPHSPPQSPSPESQEKSKLSEFLYIPPPPVKKKTTNKKSSGAKVLTSVECMQEMEEKERRKKEEADLKEKRRIEREKKRQEREALAAQKAAAKAAKKAPPKKGRNQKNLPPPPSLTPQLPQSLTLSSPPCPQSPPDSQVKSKLSCPVKRGTTGKKPSGVRMLTSVECMQRMEEKERRKKEEADLKEKRRIEREKKRQEREALAAQKAAAKAAKKAPPKKDQELPDDHPDECQPSECMKRECKHKTGRNWVSCKECSSWFHCICIGVKWSEANRTDYSYICVECLK